MTTRPEQPLLNAPPPRRMHRLEVLEWPTPENAPFAHTDDRELYKLWCWVTLDTGRPDWLPDHYTKEFFPALLSFDPNENVPWPTFSRFNYISGTAAAARARLMGQWGITARIAHSDLITWPEGTR